MGARLIVLPELSDSGYVFESREEAFSLSGAAHESPTITGWESLAKAHGLHIVAGFSSATAMKLYNSAVDHRPRRAVSAPIARPICGARRAVISSAATSVFRSFTPLRPVGVSSAMMAGSPRLGGSGAAGRRHRLRAHQLGADGRPSRTTCPPWPMSCAWAPRTAIRCSSLPADRIGTERGQPFIGQSLIVDHEGWPVAGPASAGETRILIAECDLARRAAKAHLERLQPGHARPADRSLRGNARHGRFARLVLSRARAQRRHDTQDMNQSTSPAMTFKHLVAAAFCAGMAARPGLAQDTIKIGIPVGLSGANSVVAPSVVQSSRTRRRGDQRRRRHPRPADRTDRRR